jgi:hypothetical protein
MTAVNVTGNAYHEGELTMTQVSTTASPAPAASPHSTTWYQLLRKIR